MREQWPGMMTEYKYSSFQTCPKQISPFQAYQLFPKQLPSVFVPTNPQTNKVTNLQTHKPMNTLIYIIPNPYPLEHFAFFGKKK